MKKLSLVTLLIVIGLSFAGCSGKPNPYPNKPNYAIEKPKKIYSQASKRNLKKMVPKLQGKPYVWAEEGPHKFDCSGLTYYMYGSMGMEIPRVARQQAKVGKRVNVSNLKYGDLLFFNTDKRKGRRITHVGMYIGDGIFTHASTKKHEVVYSNIYTSKYYKNRLKVCRRYLPEEKPHFLFAKKSTPKKTQSIKKVHFAKKSAKRKSTLKVASVPKSTTPKHYIQVLSFDGSIHKVKPLVNKIKKQGLSYKTISRNNLTKLVVGPFKSSREVRKFLPRVRNHINKGAFPTRFKS
jgi:entry exclusion lipoprotein TrbK